MKKFIVLFVFSAQLLFAQQNIMQITAVQKSEANNDLETTLTITITAEIQNGFALRVPEQIRLVPLTVSLNQKPLWLQNTLSLSEADSVAGWDFSEEGLVMVFNNGQLISGDQIVITAMTALIGQVRAAEAVAELYPFSNEQISENLVASQPLPEAWMR